MGPAEERLRNLIDVELPAAAEAFQLEKKAEIDTADDARDAERARLAALKKGKK